MQKFLLSFVVVLIGSITVAATLFLNQAPLNEAHAALSVSCSTGFDRPLLFGIGHAFDSGALQTIPEMGGTFVTQGVAWDTAESTKGSVDENVYNSFNLWRDRAPNVVVLGNVSGTPQWAKDNPALAAWKAQPRRDDSEVEARFRNFIFTLVSRNKDKVKYWSYWNEPNGCQSNHHTGTCASNEDTADDYVHWLNIFYEEVKKADPSALVVGGELEMIKDVAYYVRWMNDNEARYDILAVHPYDKEKEAAFPIGWVKSAYDAQRLQNGKRPPIFVTEWGWDLDWNGVDENTAKRRITETFEIFKQNTFIHGAAYHAIRDVGQDKRKPGGEYGLRDSNGPRIHGVEFKRLSQEICGTASASGGNPPPPPPTEAACVVASHDIGSDFLEKGKPVTLTSVASVPVKTFRYTFYNSDNKKDGIAQQICVAGAPAGGNCPSGSGPLVIEVNGDTNREGAIQAASWLKLPNGRVLDSIWRGDIGWNRSIAFANFGVTDNTKWNFSNYLSIETFGTFRSTAEIDALDFYTADNKTGYMEIWRNNIGKRTEFSFNSAGDYPNWGTSKNSDIANLNLPAEIGKLPGDGVITAAGSFIVNNKLWQIHWRGNTEWVRTVPISSGKPDFSRATAYTQGRSSSSLPTPNVKIQAVNFILMPNNTEIQEQIWLNDQMHQRRITVSNGNPDFANAPNYNKGATEIAERSPLTNSSTVEYNKLHVVDTRTGKIPENVQINATFATTNGNVRDDGKCVMRFAFAKGVEGDVDGNCVNDIYDYNLLLQHYNTDNCTYNLTGSGCRIDAADVKYLTDRFGQKCE